MVLVGQNLRPYFKFTLPTLEILGLERDIWDQANSDSFDPNQVYFHLVYIY
jgi:Bardet-Biedl syndrome 1 protein